ncbi:hypothetical protein ACU4GD_35260 [Cupriavidus basilensis]
MTANHGRRQAGPGRSPACGPGGQRRWVASPAYRRAARQAAAEGRGRCLAGAGHQAEAAAAPAPLDAGELSAR